MKESEPGAAWQNLPPFCVAETPGEAPAAGGRRSAPQARWPREAGRASPGVEVRSQISENRRRWGERGGEQELAVETECGGNGGRKLQSTCVPFVFCKF